jgi:hypothetical protein
VRRRALEQEKSKEEGDAAHRDRRKLPTGRVEYKPDMECGA